MTLLRRGEVKRTPLGNAMAMIRREKQITQRNGYAKRFIETEKHGPEWQSNGMDQTAKQGHGDEMNNGEAQRNSADQ